MFKAQVTTVLVGAGLCGRAASHKGIQHHVSLLTADAKETGQQLLGLLCRVETVLFLADGHVVPQGGKPLAGMEGLADPCVWQIEFQNFLQSFPHLLRRDLPLEQVSGVMAPHTAAPGVNPQKLVHLLGGVALGGLPFLQERTDKGTGILGEQENAVRSGREGTRFFAPHGGFLLFPGNQDLLTELQAVFRKNREQLAEILSISLMIWK